MECQICFYPYNELVRRPKNLVCGHAYCEVCLGKLLDVATSEINCPKDRKVTNVPDGNIKELVTNYAILELLSDTCQDCHEKTLSSQCLPDHCSLRLCNECKKTHIEGFRDQVLGSISDMRKRVDNLEMVCKDNQELDEMVGESKAAIAEVSRVFDAEKERLIQFIKLREQSDTNDYLKWKSSLNMRLVHLRSFLDVSHSRVSLFESSASDLADMNRQLSHEKDEVAKIENSPCSLTRFNTSYVQRKLETIIPDLERCLMPQGHEPQIRAMASAPPLQMSPSTEALGATTLFPDYSGADFKQFYGTAGSGEGGFIKPWDISTSPVTGNLAVTDTGNHRIHILTANLQPVISFGRKGSGDDQFNNPMGVAFNSIGNLFITDCYNHRIKQVTETGSFICKFGSKGTGLRQFREPRGIAWADGLLYVCDCDNYRIEVFKDDGTRVMSIRCADCPEIDSKPWHIAVSPMYGKLLVSDISGKLHAFCLDGQYRKTLDVEKSSDRIYASGTVVDPLGQIIISDWRNGNVMILGENEELLTTLYLPGQYMMNYPQGIALTHYGDIIVCELDKHRIVKFQVPQIK